VVGRGVLVPRSSQNGASVQQYANIQGARSVDFPSCT